MPRRMSGQAYIGQARTFRAAGADGFIVWDSERRHPNVSEWNILKHLGHRGQYGELERLAEQTFRTIPLKTHRGISTMHSFSGMGRRGSPEPRCSRGVDWLPW